MPKDWNDDSDDILVDGLVDDLGRRAQRLPDTKIAAVIELLPRMLERVQALLERNEGREQEIENRWGKTFQEGFGSLAQQIAVLETQVSNLAAKLPAGDKVDGPAVRSSTAKMDLTEKVGGGSAAAPDVALSAQKSVSNEALSDRQWERLLVGEELSAQDALAKDRRQLLADVLRGEAPAVGLASRLMLVHSASAEEIPTLLKEIGEAYYRWRPKSLDATDPFEQALVRAMQKRIVAVGLRNSIEIVCPGDRYDAARHVTSDRGVEVTVVRGWTVLRENGKPLTKASVSLR